MNRFVVNFSSINVLPYLLESQDGLINYIESKMFLARLVNCKKMHHQTHKLIVLFLRKNTHKKYH